MVRNDQTTSTPSLLKLDADTVAAAISSQILDSLTPDGASLSEYEQREHEHIANLFCQTTDCMVKAEAVAASLRASMINFDCDTFFYALIAHSCDMFRIGWHARGSHDEAPLLDAIPVTATWEGWDGIVPF